MHGCSHDNLLNHDLTLARGRPVPPGALVTAFTDFGRFARGPMFRPVPGLAGQDEMTAAKAPPPAGFVWPDVGEQRVNDG
jgi:hypothetical protein